MTPTFTPPEVTRMRTYELIATPLICSGQRGRARVVEDSQNVGSVMVSLRALVCGGRISTVRAVDVNPHMTMWTALPPPAA
jgi:hypothetical protein